MTSSRTKTKKAAKRQMFINHIDQGPDGFYKRLMSAEDSLIEDLWLLFYPQDIFYYNDTVIHEKDGRMMVRLDLVHRLMKLFYGEEKTVEALLRIREGN